MWKPISFRLQSIFLEKTRSFRNYLVCSEDFSPQGLSRTTVLTTNQLIELFTTKRAVENLLLFLFCAKTLSSFCLQTAELTRLFANSTVIGVSDNGPYSAINHNGVFGAGSNQAGLFTQAFFD